MVWVLILVVYLLIGLGLVVLLSRLARPYMAGWRPVTFVVLWPLLPLVVGMWVCWRLLDALSELGERR